MNEKLFEIAGFEWVMTSAHIPLKLVESSFWLELFPNTL